MQYKNVLRRVTVLSLSGMLFLSGGGDGSSRRTPIY